MTNIYQALQTRGFIAQLSDNDLPSVLNKQLTMYIGFDPTADSLHVGHLLPIIAMAHFQRHGHRPIVVVGGATGMVGDPSGRSDERNLLSSEAAAHNAAALKRQLARFIEFGEMDGALLLDNNDWIEPMSFIDWLCDVGKHFTVNYMLAKDSVRSRVESEGGISFTEFSYMTMQAYDFLHLFDEYGCVLQGGGNDQWGNITAGIELVRRVRSDKVYGLTFPLISTSKGEKFGKSAGNAIWLDPERTSIYDFYQYWIRTADADVERFLKLFTFLPLDTVAGIIAEHERSPERRFAQRTLAAEMTRVVHGDEGLKRAEAASEALFGGNLTDISRQDLLEVFDDVPSIEIPYDRIGNGVPVIDLLLNLGLCSSRSDARRMARQGAVTVNNHRIEDVEGCINDSQLLCDSLIVLRIGKKRYGIARFQRDLNPRATTEARTDDESANTEQRGL